MKLQNQPIKTTLTFNWLFHHRLKTWARTTNKGMAQVIEDELLPILEMKQRARQKRIVAGLRALSGVITDAQMADAVDTADDYLYGSKAFNDEKHPETHDT
jgi:hypothetical protein